MAEGACRVAPSRPSRSGCCSIVSTARSTEAPAPARAGIARLAGIAAGAGTLGGDRVPSACTGTTTGRNRGAKAVGPRGDSAAAVELDRAGIGRSRSLRLRASAAIDDGRLLGPPASCSAGPARAFVVTVGHHEPSRDRTGRGRDLGPVSGDRQTPATGIRSDQTGPSAKGSSRRPWAARGWSP